MRNNREKWSFYSLPFRQDLSAEKVMYWKNMLKKILKVGIEFEYNLPEKNNGTCKGDSPTCPCVNLSIENKCWQKCITDDEECPLCKKNVSSCKNATSKCNPKDCETCTKFEARKCPGIYCTNFISACNTCEKFSPGCNNCKFKFDPDKDPESIRKAFIKDLKPVNSYGKVGTFGVHSVKTDGSLLGKEGAEIVTVGRRVDYWEFYKMAKNIIDMAKSRGAYVNERCSTHMHVLAGYFGLDNNGKFVDTPTSNTINEMEKEMPEIILANLHQLVRRYQNAMTWMMMALDSPAAMTRWEKFRIGVIPISAVMYHMKDVRSEVARLAGKNNHSSKYGWVNYNNLVFDNAGNISRFHLEFRGADGIMCPSAIAALGCMYYALVIKAVEISRYGVVEVGNKEWLEQAEVIKEALMNNTKAFNAGDRFSDTSLLYKYHDILISEALDLVHQLKPILIKIGPAYEVLEKLAERPVAIRRCEGQTWETIEKDLEVIIDKDGLIDVALSEIVTLNQVSECKNVEEWIQEASKVLIQDSIARDTDINTEEVVQNFVRKRCEDGKMIWSNSIGAPIMI